MTSVTERQARIVRAAAQYRPLTFLLALLLFPFQLVGWAAAIVWLVLTFAWAAVAVSFTEMVARVRRDDRG